MQVICNDLPNCRKLADQARRGRKVQILASNLLLLSLMSFLSLA